MIEREVKIPVDDHAPLVPLLQAMGATRARVEQEVNRILDTPDGSLAGRGQVLRMRSADKQTLTWKGRPSEHEAGEHKVREELEVEIAAEGTETMLALLAQLGFREVLRYDKRRETWRWHGVSIALDHLSFGDYVEIEGEAGVIEEAIRRLRLQGRPLERRSYPELQRQAQQQPRS